MGPRLFSRGRCPGWNSVSARDKLASMGPRLFSRGRGALRRPGRVPGISFNGAAAFQPRKEMQPNAIALGKALLQWGRGFSAAEGKV